MKGRGWKAAQCVSPSLNPKAIATASGKLCAGKPARTVWEGGDGKGLRKHLAGVLLHSEGGGRKRATNATSSAPYLTLITML
jgi:hypothetical protein